MTTAVSVPSAFRRLLISTGVSSVGDGVRLIAMPWMATRFTSDPQLIAGVVVADRLPWLLFLLPGGALADRFDRLRMRVVLDVFRAILGGVFVVLVATGHVGLAAVYVVTALMASAEAIVDSSSMALVPSLVESDDLESAVGRLQATEIVTRDLIGPALGGALFTIGVVLPLAVDAVSFAVSAAVAVTIRGSFRVVTHAQPTGGVRAAVGDMGRSIGAGLVWLWREPTLRALAFLSMVLSLVSTVFVAVLIVFVAEDLGLSARGFGLLMVPSAIGGVLGAWVAPHLRHLPFGAVVGGAAIASGAAEVLIARTSAIALIAVLLVVDMAGVVVWSVLTVALRQRTIPGEMLGRVSSSYRFLLSAGAPLGAVIGGALAASVGARDTLAIAGAATCLAGALAIAVLARGATGGVPALPTSAPA